MNKPLISIITPVLNVENLIEGFLDNVSEQTLENFEIFFIDGGSTDNTIELIKKHSFSKKRIEVEPIKGIYTAMNKGIDVSKGTWLYFMGCDDRFIETSILEKVALQLKSTTSHFIYGNVIFKHSGFKYDGYFSPLKLMGKNISHQAIFYKSNIFLTIGKYNTDFTSLADWEYNMRCFSCSSIKRKYIPLIIAVYNETGFSSYNKDLSFEKLETSLKKIHFNSYIRFLEGNRNKILVRAYIKLLYNPFYNFICRFEPF